MPQTLDILTRCPLFAGNSAQEIETMLHCLCASERNYAAKSVIFAAGAEVYELGVVLRGGVDVVQEDFWGNQSILARLSPGQVFAESFVLAQLPHLPVSVIADQATSVMLLDYRRILHTCNDTCPHHESLIHNLLFISAQKNVHLTQKIEIVTKKTIKDKLLIFLSQEAKKAGSNHFHIPYDRQALADYLAVDRSALSRTLGDMQIEGLIQVDKSTFTLRTTM